MHLDQCWVDAEQLGLGLIGVTHHTAHDIGRRARAVGEPSGQESSGARFRGRDAPVGKQSCHQIVHLRAVFGVDLIAMAIAQQSRYLRIGVCRAQFVPRDHLDFSAPQACRDL